MLSLLLVFLKQYCYLQVYSLLMQSSSQNHIPKNLQTLKPKDF